MKKIKLKDICNISTGGTPSRSNINYWNNGDIPWCKIGDFSGKYINQVKENITEEGLKNSSAKIFKRGTILYTIFATVGEVAILETESATNQAIAGLELINNEVDLEYLYYYLKSLKFVMLKKSRGVAQNNINLGILKNIEIKIPDKMEQINIAKILANIEKVIDKKNKQLKELNTIIKSQFVEMFGNKDFKKEKLKNNIIEMFIGPFGSALKNEYFVDKENGYSVVYEQKHAINKNIKEFRWVDENKYKSLERFNVKPGDIIVSCRGTVGKTYIIPDDAPIGIMHPSIMKIRLKKEKYIPKFFEKVLEEYLEDKERETMGAIIKMGIKASQLEKEYFIIPDLSVQTKYLNIVKQIDKQKFEIEKSLKETQELYESLMEKYFG